MLYVDDVEKNAAFWRAIGFAEKDRQEMDGTLVIEVGIEDSQTSFVLYDRAFVESHSPGTATSAPSLMFYSKDIFGLYKKMQTQSVTLGDMVQLGEEYVFNFAILMAITLRLQVNNRNKDFVFLCKTGKRSFFNSNNNIM